MTCLNTFGHTLNKKRRRNLLEGFFVFETQPSVVPRGRANGYTMQSPIKAIETVYSGCCFRSRLEARFAIYFEKMGYRYEYEKEGYQLGDLCYLPDFYLPNYRILVDRDGNLLRTESLWVEIKAEAPSDAEMEKMRRLVNLTNTEGLICCGTPGVDADVIHLIPGDSNAFWHLHFFDLNCPINDGESRSWNAAISASSARFEHGQKGAML